MSSFTRVVTLLALAAAAVVSDRTAVHAEEEIPPHCHNSLRSGRISCGGAARDENQGQAVRSGSLRTAYEFVELWRPTLTPHPDGGQCIQTVNLRLGRNPTATEFLQSERQLTLYLSQFPLCPDAEAPQVTPAMVAAAFYQSVTLPTPEPHVAPGQLPVGLESFLETGAPTTQSFGPVDTPFGPLTLTATAEIYVDWDDPHDGAGRWEGPFTDPGPHPDGGVRHVYQYEGYHQISVRYDWTASWAIGDITGTIGGVQTSGTYPAPGFETYSRQAVGR